MSKEDWDATILRLGNMLWEEDDTVLETFLKECKDRNLKRKE